VLDEPYRWLEAIRNRREYLEDQLAEASPVVGTRYENGVLLLTSTPGPRKLFEVYDRVAFAAVGHPADIEKLRQAVIDIAHLEAFNLSASDVSLQRLVSFGLGPMMKTAFDEIFRAPFIARIIVAELDPGAGLEAFHTIAEDGSFAGHAAAAVVAGNPQSAEAVLSALDADEARPLSEQLPRALEAWAAGRLRSESEVDEPPDREAIAACVRQVLESQRIEAAVLDRSLPTSTKFRLLTAAELQPVLSPFTS